MNPIRKLQFKKGWLDKLYYYYGRQLCDYELCYLKKEGDEVIASKWVKYSKLCFPIDIDDFEKLMKLEKYNNRTILPNEIVLDLEDKESLPSVKEKLKKLKWANMIFFSGSRGYHVHIFFPEKISTKVKEKIIDYFGADKMKAYERSMIALEFSNHWKTGNEKELVEVNSYYGL